MNGYTLVVDGGRGQSRMIGMIRPERSIVRNLGQISWADQTGSRIEEGAVSALVGLGIGTLMAVALPSARLTRRQAWWMSGASAALSLTLSAVPAEGKLLDRASAVAAAGLGLLLPNVLFGK